MEGGKKLPKNRQQAGDFKQAYGSVDREKCTKQ